MIQFPIITNPYTPPVLKCQEPFSVKVGYASIMSREKTIQMITQKPKIGGENGELTVRWRLVPPDFDTSFIPRLPRRYEYYINEEEERRMWLENGYTYQNGMFIFFSNDEKIS